MKCRSDWSNFTASEQTKIHIHTLELADFYLNSLHIPVAAILSTLNIMPRSNSTSSTHTNRGAHEKTTCTDTLTWLAHVHEQRGTCTRLVRGIFHSTVAHLKLMHSPLSSPGIYISQYCSIMDTHRYTQTHTHMLTPTVMQYSSNGALWRASRSRWLSGLRERAASLSATANR